MPRAVEGRTSALGRLFVILTVLAPDFVRVEGSYYAPPLSVRSGHEPFASSGSRRSWLALLPHVDVIVTAFVNGKQVIVFPVIVVAINMMEMYLLFT